MDIFYGYNIIYNSLKEYIKNIYNEDIVFKSIVDEKYPLITIEMPSNELNNVSTCYREKIRQSILDINIYAIGQTGKPAKQQVEELSNLVVNFIEDNFRLKGGITNSSPSFNGKTLSYSCNIRFTLNQTNRNRIY